MGRQFKIIDTGGVLNNLNLPFQDVVNQQVNFAIEEANIILFMVSYKEGINKNDHYIAKLLKKNCKNKKIILVVNKSENVDQTKLKQFYSLKFGNFFLVSASHGLGTGDLLDAIVACIPNKQDKKEETSFKFCIVGKPNVGKSSLVNAILNENRVIVSPQANTTRDSIDCKFKYQKKSYTIIDTAGIRRKGKISEYIDKYAYLRTKEAISRSNLIIMMLDATNEVSEQDKIIGGLAYNANIPTIIVINK
ncbi:50S ribosome-binding GTPase [bacterium]|nr:50S ribosome-binding GTPase [bacterium]